MITLEYLRHFKIFEFAIFDLTVSIIGIYLLSPLLSKIFKKINIDIPKINWVFLTLPIGILAHLMAGTITPMTKYFIDIHSHYFIKIFMAGLIILGLKGIKIIKKN
ncbi:MAG: hypothetical protein NTU81_00745 [Candidatus Nomurabacteria bacterium]|nr:hypothetical protein [Candidatus Nomurabacteria bacterium]